MNTRKERRLTTPTRCTAPTRPCVPPCNSPHTAPSSSSLVANKKVNTESHRAPRRTLDDTASDPLPTLHKLPLHGVHRRALEDRQRHIVLRGAARKHPPRLRLFQCCHLHLRPRAATLATASAEETAATAATARLVPLEESIAALESLQVRPPAAVAEVRAADLPPLAPPPPPLPRRRSTRSCVRWRWW